MVGPFLQGILLMGVIYWYSKGMLSLINDHYRTEFQRKVKVDEPANESSDFSDVDQMAEHQVGKVQRMLGTKAAETHAHGERAEYHQFAGERVCVRESRLGEFYRIVEQALSICWIGETMAT